MPQKKGKRRANRSTPDAEEVAAEGQVNVDVDIHPAPPEEDMPAEAVQTPSKGPPIPPHPPPPPLCRWSSMSSNIQGGTNAMMVCSLLNPAPIASSYICNWSYKQHWQSAIGRATSRGSLRLVVQPVVAICDWSCNQSWRSAFGCTICRSDLRLVVRLPMTSLAINQ